MIRKANINDSLEISKLIVSGWQTAYRGLIDDKSLDDLSVEEINKGWFERLKSHDYNNFTYLYEEGNKILGVIRFGNPIDDSKKYNAEIHALYVEPFLKRKGIGTKLFNYAKEYFKQNNKSNMIIWCLKGNEPSIKFYKKMGGRIIKTRKTNVHGIYVEEVGIEFNLIFEIKEYEWKYAESMSNIITRNILEINSKDYGKELSKKQAKEFTVDRIKKYFKNRTKVYVAVENDEVIGTASLDKSWYENDGEYWILTVFVKPENHGQGIGKALIRQIEEYANTINVKKLIVPSSIHACEFYHKLGYEYKDGRKELNEEGMYMMEKILKAHI